MTTGDTTREQVPPSASRSATRPANHTINLNGKEYILFAGLLDEAHRQGLNAVKTCLLHVPTREQPLAVVSAEVTTGKGTFHGLGDASPDNVNEWIAPHLIRMAETRAVARAFRFATNISMTAFEELGHDGTGNGTVGSSTSPNGSRKPKMTQEQYIRTLCDQREVPFELEQEIQKLFDHKAKTGKISIAGGSHAIDRLKLCPKKGKAA